MATAWLSTSPASASRARAAGDATVVLRDIGFHGSTTRIRRGGHVTWLWRDGSTPGVDAISHNVTSVGRPHFRGAYTRDHGSYRIRFDAAGTYRYECTIHYGMTGRIVVS
ncbi:MAG TPA: plastocyanin/azurin family copper-binding protein [Solirubrobacteraceae bacterium]|jgi:plastocyanin